MVTAWIAQTQADRTRAEAELRTTPRRMSQGEITALVTALGDITTVLRDADPADKAEVCG
ncbi:MULTISPECIES: hypothetical protein [Micromonospora]|uniref:hypothetical protein n=1 Tax=Micromonospora TaxID=1873 RepID=UPI003C291028